MPIDCHKLETKHKHCTCTAHVLSQRQVCKLHGARSWTSHHFVNVHPSTKHCRSETLSAYRAVNATHANPNSMFLAKKLSTHDSWLKTSSQVAMTWTVSAVRPCTLVPRLHIFHLAPEKIEMCLMPACQQEDSRKRHEWLVTNWWSSKFNTKLEAQGSRLKVWFKVQNKNASSNSLNQLPQHSFANTPLLLTDLQSFPKYSHPRFELTHLHRETIASNYKEPWTTWTRLKQSKYNYIF